MRRRTGKRRKRGKNHGEKEGRYIEGGRIVMGKGGMRIWEIERRRD